MCRYAQLVMHCIIYTVSTPPPRGLSLLKILDEDSECTFTQRE